MKPTQVIGILCLVALAVGGCATPAKGVWLRSPSTTQPTGATIVVLRSSSSALMDEPLAAFVEQMSQPVVVFDTGRHADAALREAVRNTHPALILALGSRAAVFAQQSFADLPVVFAMVLNYERLSLTQPNITGVALETPTAIEFLQFKMVMPGLQRVVTFYTPHDSGDLVNRATSELHTLGIELTAVPVRRMGDVQKQYGKLGHAFDAVWLLNDATIMNGKTVAYLRDRSARDKVPLICSLSDRFVKQGAFMSVSVDFASVGAQAASVAKMVLEQKIEPAAVGIQPPIANKLAVNAEVGRRLGMQIPADALPFINEWIGTEPVSAAAPP